MARRPTPKDLQEAVRDAVDRTVAATVGQAQLTRTRATDAVDEIVRTAESRAELVRERVRTAESRAESVRERVRGALEDRRPATQDDLRALHAELRAIGRRLGAIERRLEGLGSPPAGGAAVRRGKPSGGKRGGSGGRSAT